MTVSQRISIVSFSLLAIIFAFFAFALPTYAATVTVTTTDFYGADGCGLSDALRSIKAGENYGGCIADETNSYGAEDAILFNIPGVGSHVIDVDNRDIVIDFPVIIDGTSQSGATCGTTNNFSDRVINIQIQNFRSFDFVAASAGSVVRGLSIFHGSASASRLVYVYDTSNITFECNYLGLDATGNTAYDEGDRLLVLDIIESSDITIGGNARSLGNVIAGADFDFFAETIRLGQVSDITIQNNRIGMGSGSSPNIYSSLGDHIELCRQDSCGGWYEVSSNIYILNNEFRNENSTAMVLSGNNMIIADNYIIVENGGQGVFIRDSLESHSSIRGNIIVSTQPVFGNHIGIFIDGSSHIEIVDNDISGFFTALNIFEASSDIYVYNNDFYASSFGVFMSFLSDVPGSSALNNVSILGNRIYNILGVTGLLSAGGGIEMFNITGNPPELQNPTAWEHFGPNVNDSFDADTGPNNFQNWPEILATTDNGDGTVSVQFTTDFQPGEYRIEFFRNSIFPESGHGEGEEFIDHINIEHAGQGPQSFTIDLPLSVGQHISSTATVIDEGTRWGFGPTSEFGNSFTVFFVVPPTPTRSSGGSVQQRVSNLVDMGKQQEAEQIKEQFPHLFGELTQTQKIQQLLIQIQQLQAILNQLTNNTPSPQTLVCTPALRIGSRGENVRILQSILNITADGIYGPQTANAVGIFQEKNNLTQDQIAGPKTCSALLSQAQNQ
jgi:hypothetical protein